MLNRPATPRLHLRSIHEEIPDVDEEIADLFREMRQATGLSLGDTAAKLQTAPATVEALERGAIRSLPAWPETRRVVADYAGLLNLDPDPVLRRIALQLPPEHPRRPLTEAAGPPSYENVRSNIDAVLHRVPDDQRPTEQHSLPAQHLPQSQAPRAGSASGSVSMPASAPAEPAAPHGTMPGYGDFRAYPPEPASSARNAPPPVAERRKKGRFVLVVQLFLLLILLASGYAMWLVTNDPQGFENLKSLAGDLWWALASGVKGLLGQ